MMLVTVTVYLHPVQSVRLATCDAGYFDCLSTSHNDVVVPLKLIMQFNLRRHQIMRTF